MISIIYVSMVMVLIYWMWILLTKQKIPIQLAVCISIFFIPKINLISVSRISTTGVRIDDILILFLLLSTYCSKIIKVKWIKDGIKLLLMLSLLSLLSTVVGIINGFQNSIIYAILVIIRKIEYFSLIICGYYIGMRTDNKRLIKHINILNFGLMFVAFLQICGICGYAVSGNESSNFFGGIAVSTFNGYYEYGQYLLFSIIMYYVFLQKKYGKMYTNFMMMMLSLVFVYMTNSRTSLLCAILLVLLMTIKFNGRRISKRIFLICIWGLVVILLLGLVTVLQSKVGGNRFATFNLHETINYFLYYIMHGNIDQYRNMILSGREIEGITSAIVATNDLSLSIRIFKWGSAINGFLRNPILGYGYGVTYVMDGNYVKLLGEIGIVGTYCWIKLLYSYLKQMRISMKEDFLSAISYFMIIAVCISAMFIDMFDASKIMEYLWFFIGITLSKIRIYRRDVKDD